MSKSKLSNSLVLPVLYGIIAGVVVFLEMLLEFAFGYHSEKLATGSYLAFIKYLIFLVFALILVLKLKKTENPTFSYIFSRLAIYTLILSVLVGISHLVYHNVVNPNFHDDYAKYMIEKISKSEISAEHKELKISEAMRGLEQWKEYETSMGMYKSMLQSFIVNMLFGLILSTLFSKNKNENESIEDTVR